MVELIKKLYVKYKTLVNYGVFGVLTTIVNYVSFWAFSDLIKLSTVPANILAWVVSCIFAYITNKIWVFESKEKSSTGIVREVVSFFASRLVTLGVETVIMWFFVDVMSYNKMIIKLIANVIVIVLNFVLSKLVVFRKTNQNK